MAGLLGQSLILEQVRIHTDRELYASGETIWLKLYVTDALTFRPTSLSAVAYVELWDVQGKIIFQTKVLLEKGQGMATIDIPPDQKTGEYLIRSYTRWMANGASDEFAHQAIIIFNPNQSIPVRDTSKLTPEFNNLLETSPGNHFSPKSDNSLQIELSLNKTEIGGRKKVQLEINTKDAQGNPVSANLSLSSAKAFPIQKLILSPYVRSESKEINQKPEANQLPDLYGVNLSGSVLNYLGQGVAGAKIVFCLPGKIPLVQYAESTPEGWFRFLIPDLYGNQEILISAVGPGKEEFKISLDTDILGGRPKLPNWSFTFPPDIVEELHNYMLQYQLQKAYQTEKQKINEENALLKPFYQTANHVYILNDYTRFSIEETFREIIYSVALNKAQGQPYARVYNAKTGEVMEGDPLILIDGIPTSDIRDLLTLKSKEVERIEVLTSPYFLYGQVYDGIIHAVTFQGDAKSIAIPDGAIRRPYAFFAPDRIFQHLQPEPARLDSQSARIPDMRRLLLWKPMIQTNEEGKAQLSFWTSDIEGIFEVEVQGFTDLGLWGENKIELTVVGENP